MDSPIDEIKNKLDLIDVVSEYVRLLPAGTNMKAPCPFHKEKIPSFFVSADKQIWKCFGCLPPGSPIKTQQGFLKIEDIQRGELVLTHRGRFMSVIRNLWRKYTGDLIEIRTRKSNEITTLTGDHKVFVMRTKYCKYKSRKTRICQRNCKKCSVKYFLKYKVEKIAARKLMPNDYLLYPVNKKIKKIEFIDLNKYYDGKRSITGPNPTEIPTNIKVDEKFLKLIGYYIAEGSNHRAYIRFSLGNHEKEFAKEIKKLVENIFRIKTSIHQRKKENKTGLEITACNSKLANIFENLCGKGAEKKHIPFKFQYLSLTKQEIILKSIFKGDGYEGKVNKCIKKRKYKAITTISTILAEQLKDVLLRLKKSPGLYVQKGRVDKRGANHRKAYTIFWQENNILHFSDFYKDKQGNFNWLLPISKIKKKNYCGNVYNLTVAEDHSYVAKNFVVGNCGKGGNMFDFIMETEGVDFPQALRILAQKAGVTLKSQDYHLTSKKTKIIDILQEATQYYHWLLLNGKIAEEGREYLKKRKLEEKTIKEWQIGFAPNDWRLLYQHLTKKGFKDSDILEAGLIVKSSEGGFYDRFRGRIMFPIGDSFGNVLGFSARILPSLDKEDVPKYINSPETPVYSKSKVLFGLDKAKLEIKKRGYTILVEGNVDVITAHQTGTKNVVAVSGTALTLTQVKILKRYSPNIILAFDFDPSGQASTKRGIDIALSQEMNIKVLTLPKGKDPDDCIKEDKAAWLGAIKDSQPIMEYYFSSAFRNFNFSSVNDQKKVSSQLLPVIANVGNLIEQDFWLKKLADQAKISYEILRENLKKIIKKEKISEKEENLPEINQEKVAQEIFVGLLINFPEQISSFYDDLNEDLFVDDKLKKVICELKKKYNLISLDRDQMSREEFRNAIDDEMIKSYIDFLILSIEKDFILFDKKAVDKELEFLFKRIRKNYIGRQLKSLNEELGRAEKDNQPEKIKEISEKISTITQELKKCS